MKKVFLLIVLALLLSSCGSPVHFIGKVESKSMTEAWTETIPAGYRTDCGITINGKMECGFKFFINPTTKYHPATYTLVVSGDGCQFYYSTDEATYLHYESGMKIELDLYNFQLGECATEQSVQWMMGMLPVCRHYPRF